MPADNSPSRASDIEAALRNPGELMRHVGLWLAHSAPMVGPVMEAIARRTPEEFLKNIDSLSGVLPDRDIKAWLQLAIHASAQEARWSALLQHAGVPQRHFGNSATAVILSIATRNLPWPCVFDEGLLRRMKEWKFTDSEIFQVLQPAVPSIDEQDWGKLRSLGDDLLGTSLSTRLFTSRMTTAATHVVPATTGRQLFRDIDDIVARDPKSALDRLALHCSDLQTEDVLHLVVRLRSRLPIEEVFDSRFLKVLRDKNIRDQDVLAVLRDAIAAVPADAPLPLQDILFFSPAWTPFVSAEVIGDVVKLLKTKLPQDVMWFKEHLAPLLTEQDRREVFGDDDPYIPG